MHELWIHNIFGKHCIICWYEKRFDWYKKADFNRDD
jgi:hypothetical protein